jgi:hypothetical protein
MKIRDVIQEFIPCEVCGNRDIRNFHFHVFVHRGSQPYVKCCECEEEYYSTRAREVITRIEDAKKVKVRSIPIIKNSAHPDLEKQEYMHPLLKVLSGF